MMYIIIVECTHEVNKKLHCWIMSRYPDAKIRKCSFLEFNDFVSRPDDVIPDVMITDVIFDSSDYTVAFNGWLQVICSAKNKWPKIPIVFFSTVTENDFSKNFKVVEDPKFYICALDENGPNKLSGILNSVSSKIVA